MIAVNPDRTRCPYEVGDILQTINSTPPAQRWPGTQWQQITDRFVRGADSQHPAGSTGGSWTHTQTLPELATHTHPFTKSGSALLLWTDTADTQDGFAPGDIWANISKSTDHWTDTAGGSQPMDITNPYYSAYIWLRTG